MRLNLNYTSKDHNMTTAKTHSHDCCGNKQEHPTHILGIEHELLERILVGVTGAAVVLGYVLKFNGGTGVPVAEFVLAVVAYVAGGFFGVQVAWAKLRQRKLDVDALMILAALGAALIGQWHEGALLLFLFSLSHTLQDYALGRSRNAIQSLMKLYPNEAQVRTDDGIVTRAIDALQVGDVVLIAPGERVAVDGVVVAGRSTVDQSPITGESLPVEKNNGDKMFAGTLNIDGALDVRTTQLAGESTLARIIHMVENAQDSKAPTQRFLEAFEERYALAVVGVTALFIFAPPLLWQADWAASFYRAMVLMTVASPCALVISTPAAFLAAIASAARGGVLFKGGAYLEQLAAIKAVAFDKTGTLTQGRPVVSAITSCCEITDDQLLRLSAAVEARSEHPLARAIVDAAAQRRLAVDEVTDFTAIAGAGVRGRVGDVALAIGSPRHMGRAHTVPPTLAAAITQAESDGHTVMLIWQDGVRAAACADDCAVCAGADKAAQAGRWLGMIALADSVRPEASAAVRRLQQMGVRVAMLTGDNQRTAARIAAQVGVDKVYAELMPQDKVTTLKAMQAEFGPSAMVGDGVNDAPAMAQAEIGIAMGAAGTDVALETADVVLMSDRLEQIAFAIGLSKKARRVVWQNIIFSLAVIAMLLVATFAIALPLPLGVLGHEGSTVLVVLNGLIVLLLIPELQRRRAAGGVSDGWARQ
jgi:Zn2+/Cd2+-exporting ATPase